MLLKTQAVTEIARFLGHHPTPEQIVAFHPSAEIAERAYELICSDRGGVLAEEKRQELERYVVLEYLMELVKLEAQRQLLKVNFSPPALPQQESDPVLFEKYSHGGSVSHFQPAHFCTAFPRQKDRK